MASPADETIHVLLIEDCELDATFVTRLLGSCPSARFEIDQAASLNDALRMMQAADYDVAMLDLTLPDAEELESFEQIRALDARIPIIVFTGSDDEELGLLAIESGAQDFMAKGHVTGQMLFRAIRFAIARQRKMLGFQAAADSDPLTGMPNRRRLQNEFAERLAWAESHGQPVSLALFDVDHFKAINDQHGHCVGDAVLKEIADRLGHATGTDMLAARFGGEEFAMLMPGFTIQEASRFIVDFLRRLAGTPMQLAELVIPVTASAGVIDVAHHESWETCYEACDAALYRAKSEGRNRLVAKGRLGHVPTEAPAAAL